MEPLLKRMMEQKVGDLIVRKDRIYEPLSGCRVAHSFPTEQAAIAAATEMNEVADWVGVLKTRAEGNQPNCQDELERIIKAHGGEIASGSNETIERHIASIVRDR